MYMACNSNSALKSYYAGWLLTLQLSVFFPLYYIFGQMFFLKYLLYMIPAIMVFFSVVVRQLPDKNVIIFVALFIIVCVSSIYHSPRNFSSFSELYFLLGAAVCFVASPIIKPVHMKVLLVSCIVTMLMVLIRDGGKGISLDLTQSEGGAEGSYGVMLGALMIYFLVLKNRIWFIVALLATIFAFKRISLAGAILSCTIYLLLWPLNIYRIKFLYIIVSLVIIVAGLVTWFFPEILDFIFYFGIIEDPVLATSGRYTIMKYVQDEILSNFSTLFIGNGIGSSGEWVKSLGYSGFPFIGNEWVRLLFDFGFLGFTIIFFGLYKMIVKVNEQYLIFIYIIVVSLTEATFIFMFDSITFFLVARGLYEIKKTV